MSVSAVRIADVDGIPVNLSAKAGAPLLILTRMASKDMGVWDTIWDTLARHFSVANFDLRNLPGAKKINESPGEGFRDLARTCAEVATGLGHPTFHIFGWNGGTQIAMRCAVDFADRVESCLLVDPFFELPDMRRVWKAVEHKNALFENPDRSLYAYYWVMAGFSDGFLDSNFDVVDQMVADRLRGDAFIHVDADRFIRWVKALRTNWISDEEFGAIRARTLILATELDRWSAGPSIAMAREVQSRIAESRLEVIRGVGGHFLIEYPGRFLTSVEPFLKQASKAP
ncbi:MAG: alpha/beta hydrolase [Rhodospirillales bacterium]|jgi:pimeloyl-ACP methyl ester carboxylesterase|nr:alpha/beta hydrolase [Rhodospirillales bacterium]